MTNEKWKPLGFDNKVKELKKENNSRQDNSTASWNTADINIDDENKLMERRRGVKHHEK